MNEFRVTAAIIGTAINEWLGGLDGLIETLIFFVVADYVTGVFCGIAEKNLSSAIGFKGILQKMLIFMLVGMANAIDAHILGGGDHLLRTAVIFFYLSNEGISILENVTRLGLPIPDKLQDILKQIKER